jgi:hypothetical protein
MNKTKFTIVYLIYIILGLTGFFKFTWYAYVEQDSWSKYISGHFLILVCSGIITGGLLFLLYKKWMPDQYGKRKDKIWFKIGMPILYVLLGFVMNTGILLHEDLFLGYAGKLRINGVVMNKNTRSGSKGRKEYFISISDTNSTLNYYFTVKKYVYEQTKRGDVVSKDFNISRLGIIYRKEK